MKTLLLAGAGLALLAAVSLSPAMAQGPQLVVSGKFCKSR